MASLTLTSRIRRRRTCLGLVITLTSREKRRRAHGPRGPPYVLMLSGVRGGVSGGPLYVLNLEVS